MNWYGQSMMLFSAQDHAVERRVNQQHNLARFRLGYVGNHGTKMIGS
jgi:hypothetical protein